MEKNFKIIVEYDGTHFDGWQVQKKGITVQGELEKALSMILNQPIKVIGSGRTDAGVHAIGQVANFHAAIDNVKLDIISQTILKGLNSIIKTPIIIKSCNTVDPYFHARYNAISKEYHYHILNSDMPSALGRDYAWHIKQGLDMYKMKMCCDMLTGEHDFKSFEASGSPRIHTIRKIYSANMEYLNIKKLKSDSFINTIPQIPLLDEDADAYLGVKEHIIFKIVGNGFLRFMVRNIVGTLVMVGLSKITPEYFREILNSRNRTLAGATAPARGLFLMRVNYE
ncbi:MAG: tRNA pseudouridine(38-40) synthase TruA [Desulfamplus sp.]|nr:tRNA pseudouridine(38-40) synthase TruA [Desulfamplus sp.]